MKLMTAIMAVGVLGLAGCITESSTKKSDKTSQTDAAEINYDLGTKYLQAGNYELARERLERAVRQNPKLPGPHSALALLFERTGDPARAETEYKRAAKVAPDNVRVQNGYAVFLCRHKRYDEADRHFKKAINNDANTLPLAEMTNAGVCAAQKPDYERAEAYFREVLRRNPKYPAALAQMAVVSYGSKKYLPARAFVQRYLAGNEASPELLLLGAQVEDALGDQAAAADFRRRLRKDFPDSAEARRTTN